MAKAKILLLMVNEITGCSDTGANGVENVGACERLHFLVIVVAVVQTTPLSYY